MKYYLYWIHTPEQTDMWSEGYIGVTNNPDRRWKQHSNYEGSSKRLHNALRSHTEAFMEILVVGHRSDILSLERQLRPSELIGWNIVEGGSFPPSLRGRIFKHKRKEYTIKKMLDPNYRRRGNSQTAKPQKSDDDPIVAQGKGIGAWCKSMGFDYEQFSSSIRKRGHYKGYYKA